MSDELVRVELVQQADYRFDTRFGGDVPAVLTLSLIHI